MPHHFILVSPGPVDGYPPVQYQARLLAEAGHEVDLVTTNLSPDRKGTSFHHPGVKIRCVPGHGRRVSRMARFASVLYSSRCALPRSAIEIAYDPIGIFYSDMVPRRPIHRIAHFHELLHHDELYLERRLNRVIVGYEHVVVPDHDRARHTQDRLNLSQLPLVIENYPLRVDNRLVHSPRDDGRFEVVYCGSLGLNQKLDTVIRSMPLWPEHAQLVLIGNDATLICSKLRSLAQNIGVADRVRFLGWMDLPDAEARMSQADLGIALLDNTSEQRRTALGASNKRYQFMKAGLPQIGDYSPGVPELLEGNRIGVCVSEHVPAAIATAVGTYAMDLPRARVEGSRAFDMHRELYNYNASFKSFLALWESPRKMAS